MKLFVAIFIGILSFNLALSAEQNRTECCTENGIIHFHDGLPHLPDAAINKKTVCVTYLGERAYPGGGPDRPKFKGWYSVRSRRHAYAYGALDVSSCYDLIGYGNFPGFLIIDSFCNDTEHSEEQVTTALQYLRNGIPAHRDAVLIYSPTEKFPDDMTSPSYQKIQKAYEEFAYRNGIPTLDLAACLNAEIQAGRLSLSDCKNPSKFAVLRKKYADKLLDELVRKSLAKKLTEKDISMIQAKRKSLIQPHKMKNVSYETDIYPAGWLPWQFTSQKDIPHILTGTGKNIYTFSFKGSAIGIAYLSTQESGDFLYSIDDSAWGEIKVNPTADSQCHIFLLKKNLEQKKVHQLKLKLRDPEKKLSVGYFLIADFDNPLSAALLAGIDAIYAKIPPLKFTPRKKILNDLPKTSAKLTNGKKLSILLLGDSIMNGISQSNFQLLLQNMYPQCKISISTSLRGSTGCWYYQNPEQFQHYVGNKKFDLLIIGGISHKNDIEAIRNTVNMTRKSHPDSEILLMTDAWGFLQYMNPRSSCYDREPTEQDNTYQGNLLKLRNEYASGVAFMDITTPWAHYLRTCNVPYEVFKLDPVHANAFGNQVLARIIEAYFAPDDYEPYAQWQKRQHEKKK